MICPIWPALSTRHSDVSIAWTYFGNVSIWDSFLNMFRPGPATAPYTQATIPRYRNILDRGRCLYLLTEPDEVESILVGLPPEGLFLRAFVDAGEQVGDLLRKAGRWSARGDQVARPVSRPEVIPRRAAPRNPVADQKK